MDVVLGDDLTEARSCDGDMIARITADAFQNDPFNLWLFGSSDPLFAVFHLLARKQYVPHGLVYRLEDKGAAMWMLPGGKFDLPITAIPEILWLALTRTSSGGMKRISRTIAAMEANHPTIPHAYLFTIAVRPDHQGKGLGRKLIRPMLDACDRESLPAYLENSNPANSSFYASCGFERVRMIHPIDGSPPLEAMLREPR